jgi:TRAP-type mannitol/chloroaromatic compound transport system permease small subunit
MSEDRPPEAPRLIGAIDRFTERSGALIAWLMAPLIVTVAWEVVARYAFDAPTTWAYETIYMLYAALFMLGAAYALRRGAHIRTDFLWQKWSLRTRAAIEVVAYVAFFFPGMLLFLAAGAEAAWSSFALGERSAETAWAPLLWPLKALVPASAALLVVQGAAELARAMHAWRTGREFARAPGSAP